MNTRFIRASWRVFVAVLVCTCMLACETPSKPLSPAQALTHSIQSAYSTAGLSEKQAVSIALNRFTFGANPGETKRLQEQGLGPWFYSQLYLQADDLDLKKRLQSFDTLTMSDAELMGWYPSLSAAMAHMRRFYPGILPPKGEPIMDFSIIMAKVVEFAKQHHIRRMETSLLPQLEGQKIIQAVYSQNQLREVMTEFWSQHFFSSKRSFSARPWLLSFERDVLRPYALADFEVLLQRSNRHPAILTYYRHDAQASELDAAKPSLMQLKAKQLALQSPQNDTEIAQAKAAIASLDNEFALILERRFWPKTGPNKIFARNVLEQQTLGNAALFSERDINDVARAFTGWTTFPYGADQRWFATDDSASEVLGFLRQESFWFRADQHDASEKYLLGQKLSAPIGVAEGEQVLGRLALHSATAANIADKLVHYFVGDMASPSLKLDVAQAFSEHQGSTPAMLEALLTHPDFWRAASTQAKVKTPLRFVVSALRSSQAEVQSTTAIATWLSRLGQPLYGRLSQVHYAAGPENWLAANSITERFNFAKALQQDQLDGIRVAPYQQVNNASEQIKTLAFELASPEFQLH